MMADVSPEVVMQRGQAARELLATGAFVSTMNDLSDFHLAAMVACRPGPEDQTTRDYHHTMLHALRQVHEEIAMRDAAGAEMERMAAFAGDDE